MIKRKSENFPENHFFIPLRSKLISWGLNLVDKYMVNNEINQINKSIRNKICFHISPKVNPICKSLSLVLIDLTLFDLVLNPDDLRDICRDDTGTSLVL